MIDAMTFSGDEILAVFTKYDIMITSIIVPCLPEIEAMSLVDSYDMPDFLPPKEKVFTISKIDELLEGVKLVHYRNQEGGE